MPHPVLDQLGQDIRGERGREPDVRDLLLVLANAKGTLPGRALAEIGTDLDALWSSLERLRQEQRDLHEQLAQEIHELDVAKRQAIEERRFAAAAHLRDQERTRRERLREQQRATAPPELLAEVRQRLGIPDTD